MRGYTIQEVRGGEVLLRGIIQEVRGGKYQRGRGGDVLSPDIGGKGREMGGEGRKREGLGI